MMVLFIWMIFGFLTILALALVDFSGCHRLHLSFGVMPRIVQNHYVINKRLPNRGYRIASKGALPRPGQLVSMWMASQVVPRPGTHLILSSQPLAPRNSPALLEEAEPDQIYLPAFDCRNALAGPDGSDIVCPPVGPELLAN